MDEVDAVFHIPVDPRVAELEQYSDENIIKAVSVSSKAPVFSNVSVKDPSASQVYAELSAVSEEIMKCRKAAIAHLV